jgi:hypothetical protein
VVYVVKWCEHNRKREVKFLLHRSAVAFLNALLLNSNQWDAKIVKRSGNAT